MNRLAATGVAAGIVALATAALAAPNPSAGPGSVSYHPIRLAHRPATPPHNVAVPTTTRELRLQTTSVGRGNLGFEPMVAVDRTGAAFYNARTQLGSVAGKAINEQSMFRSTDGGVRWTDISGGPSQHWTSSDPYLYVDPDTGRVFWLDMAVDGGATLSFSDDRGATWTTNHIQDVGVNDHPTMVTAVAPHGSGLASTDPEFAKLAYYCTNTVAATACARSDDGGRTFVPIASPLLSMSTSGVCNGSLTGHMAADSSGRIYIGAADCGTPWVSMSADGGSTWHDVVVSNGINTPGIVNGEHDVNLALDAAGTVYAVWVDDRDFLPYVSISTDHGAHWATPMMVAPPGVNATEYASIAAGDAGRIALSFIGTHGASTDNNRPWVYYVAESTDAAASHPTFQAAIARIPGNPGTTFVGRGFDCCSAMKDFLSVVVAPTAGGAIWGSLSDACTGACVRDPLGTSDNANIGAPFVVRQISGPAMRRR